MLPEFGRFWESWDDEKSPATHVLCESVASSDTEAGLRDHVMWLQSRDVAKMAVYRAGQLRPGHPNIYRGSPTLDRTLDNTTMRSIIYFWQKHSVHDRQNLEINDDVNLVLFFFVIDLRIESFVVVVVVVFSFAFAVSIVLFFVELITISFEIELLTMLVRRMILLFADDAHFDDDDDDVLDLWLRVWLNFVKKRIRNENKSDDDHDER